MEFNNDNAKVVSEGYLTYLYGKLKDKLNSTNLSKSVRAAIEDIDIERAKKSKEKALRRMADPEKYNYKRAKDSLLRAEVRLNMKKK